MPLLHNKTKVVLQWGVGSGAINCQLHFKKLTSGNFPGFFTFSRNIFQQANRIPGVSRSIGHLANSSKGMKMSYQNMSLYNYFCAEQTRKARSLHLRGWEMKLELLALSATQ